MNTLAIYFMVAVVSIELLPLMIVRKLRPPEKAKIIRFFVTLAASALLLLLASVMMQFGNSLGRGLWCVGLLAFYGTFPFTRWLADALIHFPRGFMLFHFFLINASPWLLATSSTGALPGIPGPLKVTILVHMVVSMLRMFSAGEIPTKFRRAIVLLNGMLVGLVVTHQLLPFGIIIGSECLLLWLFSRGKNS
ncbi:MAG: hypothetical protein LBI34_02210 [Puniceicoccales bacterium]|jgi:hypothetical protein|nr:hypothetical protein [Puniceicoccales bacterium]